MCRANKKGARHPPLSKPCGSWVDGTNPATSHECSCLAWISLRLEDFHCTCSLQTTLDTGRSRASAVLASRMVSADTALILRAEAHAFHVCRWLSSLHSLRYVAQEDVQQRRADERGAVGILGCAGAVELPPSSVGRSLVQLRQTLQTQFGLCVLALLNKCSKRA